MIEPTTDRRPSAARRAARRAVLGATLGALLAAAPGCGYAFVVAGAVVLADGGGGGNNVGVAAPAVSVDAISSPAADAIAIDVIVTGQEGRSAELEFRFSLDGGQTFPEFNEPTLIDAGTGDPVTDGIDLDANGTRLSFLWDSREDLGVSVEDLVQVRVTARDEASATLEGNGFSNIFELDNRIKADLVLGHETFNEARVDSRRMNRPAAAAFDPATGRFFVADSANNRVLVFLSLPITTDQRADAVLGQKDFTTDLANFDGDSGPNQDGLFVPTGVAAGAGRLYVTDSGNNRVLCWFLEDGNGDEIELVNGQPADLVLGQANFTEGEANRGVRAANGIDTVPAADTLNLTPEGGPIIGVPTGGCAVDESGRLYVADTLNDRVLIWLTAPDVNGDPADRVLGNDSFGQQNGALGLDVLFAGPTDVAVEAGVADPDRVYVADRQNNRVAVYDPFPAVNGETIAIAIGQPDETSNAPVFDAFDLFGLNLPSSVAVAGGRVAIAEDGPLGRTLHHDLEPAVSGTPADFFLGVDLNIFALTGPSTFDLRAPTGVELAIRGGIVRSYACDNAQNRVMLWAIDAASADLDDADAVLGQPDFVSSTANNPGFGATVIQGPEAVASDGVRLAVADTLNDRILIWLTLPESDNKAADLVLGQADFDTQEVPGTVEPFLGGLTRRPRGVTIGRDVGRDVVILAASDTDNSRVLIWEDVDALAIQAQADVVLGDAGDAIAAGAVVFQEGFEVVGAGGLPAGWVRDPDVAANEWEAGIPSGIGGPSVANTGANVLATDLDDNYDDDQDDVAVISPAIDLSGAQSAFLEFFHNHDIEDGFDGGRIQVSSNGLAGPFVDVAPQGGYPGTDINGTPSFNNDFNQPFPAVDVYARVEVDLTPFAGNADVRVRFVFFSDGSVNFHGWAIDDLAVTTIDPAAIVNQPTGAFTDGVSLYVADTGNNRVLVWNAIPTLSGTPADVAVGQADLAGTLANRGSAPAFDTLFAPRAVTVDGQRMVVADTGNNRVLIYDPIPTANGQAASLVLGQPDGTSAAANFGGVVSSQTMNRPAGVLLEGDRLFVADDGNNRGLVWEGIPFVDFQNANLVIGQAEFDGNLANDGQGDQAVDEGTLFNVHGGAGFLDVDDDGEPITTLFLADTGNNRVLRYPVER